jgi:hypothetical protein
VGIRRITARIRKLLRRIHENTGFKEWYADNLYYYEGYVFRRKVLKLEMRIVWYHYFKNMGRKRISKRCNVSERYVREFLDYMKGVDEFAMPSSGTESDLEA